MSPNTYKSGVARLYCSRAKFENYFSSECIFSNFCTGGKKTARKTLVKSTPTVFVKIGHNRLIQFAFTSNKKGLRAAKISWMVAWMELHKTSYANL